MPPSSSLGFWRRPTPWVWLVFLLSMVIFSLSMITWSEGLRFRSRALGSEESPLVESALLLWSQWGEEKPRLRLMLRLYQRGYVRVMDFDTSARPQERSTFGYCDEHGRVLLNPELCFLHWRSLGKVSDADLVATLATLLHEGHHLAARANEKQAYSYEQDCLGRLIAWCTRQGRGPLLNELRLWEAEIPRRRQLYGSVGPFNLRGGSE